MAEPESDGAVVSAAPQAASIALTAAIAAALRNWRRPISAPNGDVEDAAVAECAQAAQGLWCSDDMMMPGVKVPRTQ